MDIVGVVAAVAVVVLLARLVRLARWYVRVCWIPRCQVYRRHWLLGDLMDVTDRQKYYYEQLQQHSDAENRISRFMVGPVPLIVVMHPDSAAIILKQSSPKPLISYGLLLPFIGDGLLLSSGKKWARDRRLLTNAFHFNILQEYTPLLHDSCQVFLDKLMEHTQSAESQSSPFDFSKACCLLTLDVMLRCTMGVDSNCQLEDSEYTKGVRQIAQFIFDRGLGGGMLLPDWLYFLTAPGRRCKRLCKMCHDYTAGIVMTRQQKLMDDGQLTVGSVEEEENRRRLIAKGRVDFLDILLTVRDEDGTGLSDEDVRDQVDTFLFEGHDTTSSGMQWMFYFMAKHPDIQQKCRQEAAEFGGRNGVVSHADLSKLVFITQCIKESLRMTSPVPYIERQLTEDTHVDKYVIPKGTWVQVNIFALHHNRTVYPDPYAFNPSRFSEDNNRERHPHAFVPFSAGPRNCIGQALAMNELKSALASVLLRFELTVDKSSPEPLYEDAIVMRAENGVNLLVRSL